MITFDNKVGNKFLWNAKFGEVNIDFLYLVLSGFSGNNIDTKQKWKISDDEMVDMLLKLLDIGMERLQSEFFKSNSPQSPELLDDFLNNKVAMFLQKIESKIK